MILPNWTYRKKEILTLEDFNRKCIGFIYRITFSNGQMYIGKKVLHHKKTLPPLKGKKRKRVQTRESDWLSYWGSIKNKDFVSQVKQGIITVIKREIIKQCHTQTELTYQETKSLFIEGVLESDKYLNSNILGKFYATS